MKDRHGGSNNFYAVIGRISSCVRFKYVSGDCRFSKVIHIVKDVPLFSNAACFDVTFAKEMIYNFTILVNKFSRVVHSFKSKRQYTSGNNTRN